jgi:hypothetical protein
MLYTIARLKTAPYTDEIIGDKLCEFRRNVPTAGRIFFIPQILENTWRIKGLYIRYYQISRKLVIHLGGKYYTIFSLNSVCQGT